MYSLISNSLTNPFAGLLIGLGTVCGSSSNGASEFMLRPQILIRQQTGYFGISIDRFITPSSSQEIINWLKNEGIPIAVIASITGVERKSVYAWLRGGAVKPHNQERIEKIYSLLNESKLTDLRHLYRFWNRDLIGSRSLGYLLEDKELDEASIRNALTKLWPLAKKESFRVNSSSHSIKINPFIQDSREVTTSYDL